MRKQYILTEEEVGRLLNRHRELWRAAMMAREAADETSNREYYLRAKGFEEALKMLGISDK